MLIDKFFVQTNDTIWDFLRQMGQSKEVFSSFSCVYPGMDWYVTYFYAIEKEIVIMSMDKNPEGTVEFADRGVYTEPFKFFRKVDAVGKVSTDRKDWRDSPAEHLYYAAKKMRDYISKESRFEIVPAIHCMLLTDSTLVNYPDVVKSWQQPLFGFSCLQNLDYEPISDNPNNYPFLPVNNDYSLKGGEYWKGWDEYIREKGWLDWLEA